MGCASISMQDGGSEEERKHHRHDGHRVLRFLVRPAPHAEHLVQQGDDEEESYVLVVRHSGGSTEIDVTNFTEMSISDPGGDTTLCLLVGVER